ncbi:MAG: response regulator [Geothrix sp.]|nr:response regulator [Geothrix sp.]
MAMFGVKKAKPPEGSDLVLAYLEDVQRVRATLTLMDAQGRSVLATLASVSDDRVSLSLQGPLPADKGATMSLVFLLEGLRFKASARLLDMKPASAVLELPTALSLAERRKKPRARLNAREGATAIALTGLFDGVGINGTIENISESGVGLRVDRAMEVKTQRKMHMGANLVPVGQALMLVKLTKLPKCPTLELEGTVAHLDASQGLLMGIAFDPGKASMLAPVRALVASRTTAIPTAVPPKARRQPETDREDEEPAHPRPAPKKEPEPEPPVAPAAANPVPPPAPAPVHPTPEPEPEPVAHPDERSQAILRMKKRTRGILLAMPGGPDREALAAFLTGDGYGRVLGADTLTELLEQVERPGIHLILVDGGVAELQGLALATFLRQRLEDELPPVILAETSVDADLVLGAQETGVAQVLVKPYDLDPDFRHMIEGHLGLS